MPQCASLDFAAYSFILESIAFLKANLSDFFTVTQSLCLKYSVSLEFSE